MRSSAQIQRGQIQRGQIGLRGQLRTAVAGLALGLLGLCAACEPADVDLRSTVQLLTAEQGDVAQRALAQLLPYGQGALPYLESALHNAAPGGRRNVVMALRRLDDASAAALLGHVASFDADAVVRAEARAVLGEWAVRPSAHGRRARAALRKVDEVRGSAAED